MDCDSMRTLWLLNQSQASNASHSPLSTWPCSPPCLASWPNLVMDQLMDENCDHREIDRTIDSHIRKLRRKLSDGDAQSHDWIGSVYGVGHRLETPQHPPTCRSRTSRSEALDERSARLIADSVPRTVALEGISYSTNQARCGFDFLAARCSQLVTASSTFPAYSLHPLPQYSPHHIQGLNGVTRRKPP